MEQLTFKHLLTRFSFDDILTDFKTLYQINAPESFQETDWETYRKIYQRLQELDVAQSDYVVYLSSRWEGVSPLIEI